MSRAKLAAARELIEEKQYIEARTLLLTIKDDPTATKWLAKLDERIGVATPTTMNLIAQPQSHLPPAPNYTVVSTRRERSEPQPRNAVNDQLMQYVLAAFVQNNWVVVSQAETRASLDKKVSSTGLAILLGIIALAVFLFSSIVYGVVCIGGALLLIALNNATKRGGTVQVTALTDGTVRVVSNQKALNRVYTSGFLGAVKT